MEQSIINDAIKECSEFKTVNVFKDVYGDDKLLSIYEMTSLIESEFKKKGVLKEATKKHYISLLEYVYSDKSRSLYDNELIKEFSSISGLLITTVVVDCPYEVVVTERNELNSSIVHQLEKASELQASGYEKEAVKNYIKVISESDFTQMEYRAPVIVILLFHLENMFRNNSRPSEN
ncbi:hypothetical protein [Cyclobacterium plantarum]|uniref:hypothetical protein n=1 Tax=Cyclobacterium plantarum TaxID=2716263 RepID=UPI003F71FF91